MRIENCQVRIGSLLLGLLLSVQAFGQARRGAQITGTPGQVVVVAPSGNGQGAASITANVSGDGSGLTNTSILQLLGPTNLFLASDSIGAGFYSMAPANVNPAQQTNGWAKQLANYLDLTISNTALSGNTLWDTQLPVCQHAVVPRELEILACGVNDQYYSNNYTAYQEAQLAQLAWLAFLDTDKIKCSNLLSGSYFGYVYSATGTDWVSTAATLNAPFARGLVTHTAGDFLALTNCAYGRSFIFGTLMFTNGNATAISVTIDGVTVATNSNLLPSPIYSANLLSTPGYFYGGQEMVFVFTGLAPTNHTILLTNLTGGGYFAPEWFGFVDAQLDYPSVYAAETTYEVSNSAYIACQTINQITQSNVITLQQAGLNVSFLPLCGPLLVTNDFYQGSVHPLSTGHAKMFRKAANRIQNRTLDVPGPAAPQPLNTNLMAASTGTGISLGTVASSLLTLSSNAVPTLAFLGDGQTYTAARIEGRRCYTTNGPMDNGVEEWEADSAGVLRYVKYATNRASGTQYDGVHPLFYCGGLPSGKSNIITVCYRANAACTNGQYADLQGSGSFLYAGAGTPTLLEANMPVTNLSGSPQFSSAFAEASAYVNWYLEGNSALNPGTNFAVHAELTWTAEQCP